ncbi:mannose-1-phosphate guanylyltransferase [Aeromicrobium sp. CF4.19]|uniref:mannose-1-phosphate guanylyltransferase n=1 Tax=Aeromicrobium sp. CF4.19 TaxID=3373082 RepID=UPI003EE5010C
MRDLHDLHVVIPAGGAGTRLWPLSRASRPKFLLDLTGSGRTLLQQTWDRVGALVPPERVHVVTGPHHADAVAEQLPDLQHLLVEPSPRDSMPAIGLATALIAQEHPDAVVASFAADHVIDDAEAFADAVTQAVVTARTGRVVTIGIAPRSASTAFGYIESGDALAVPGASDARAVRRFVEKPDAATARRYVADGSFSWNAGMFVTRASVLLGHLARLQPTLHDGLGQIASAPAVDRQDMLERTWPSLTRIAIDHAVAEPVSLEGGIAVVPGRFGWDDIGDFAALLDLRHDDSPEDGPPDNTVWVDADGLALSTEGVAIAVVGIPGAVVVHTGDALLVTTVEHVQQVKRVPARLAETGRDDLL